MVEVLSLWVLFGDVSIGVVGKEAVGIWLVGLSIRLVYTFWSDWVGLVSFLWKGSAVVGGIVTSDVWFNSSWIIVVELAWCFDCLWIKKELFLKINM